jgi:hypothetical protein
MTRVIPIQHSSTAEVRYEFVNEPLQEPLNIQLVCPVSVQQSLEIVFKVKVVSSTLLVIVFFAYDHGHYSYPAAELHIQEA